MKKQIINGMTGTDAKTMTTSNGKIKAWFRMAEHKTNDEGKEVTVWHNVAAWNGNAKRVENLVAGTPVTIECFQTENKWTDQNGQNRQRTELVITRIF